MSELIRFSTGKNLTAISRIAGFGLHAWTGAIWRVGAAARRDRLAERSYSWPRSHDLLHSQMEAGVSDGREEREEREKRRELEKETDREDRLDRDSEDSWVPERQES